VPLPAGSKLGRYEVLAHIGSGGMGEVYRARDTRLEKTVAIKTIATAYAQDPSAQPRFERERRLTASLEHPHICRLLDAGRENGIEYIAMEYLEGESLQDRLGRGPMPVHAAIGYGIEIAEALNYAHKQGVVHRDLKPANVFLTPTGVKVLDFGLAKLRNADRGTTVMSGDTAPLDATQAGTLIGSAPYMAPERLEGRTADYRSDIFAFGLVLYEMLTGRRAFDGTSPAALIAAILSGEPPPLALDHPKAADLEWVIRKALAKNPDERWQSMGDVQALLKRIAGTQFETTKPRQSRIPAAAALVALAAVAGVAGAIWFAWRWSSREPAAPPLVFTVHPPAGGAFTPTEGSVQAAQLALSPDGRSLAFVATGPDGVSRLWVREFATIEPVSLPGTEDATYPFWSPDGRALGFFARSELRRVDLSGGPPRMLAAAPNGRGGAWNANGEILFCPSTVDSIRRVASTGGEVREATALDVTRGETSHRWPHFLPDGNRFVYFARTTSESQAPHAGIYLASLDGDAPRLLVNTGNSAVFVPPDNLLFIREGTLLAQRIDLERATLAGDPAPVADRVGTSSNFYGAFSASHTGVIAYATEAMASELRWLDRTGAPGETVDAGRHVDFQLSPDGRFVAVADVDPETDRPDIFILDLTRGTRLRLTSSPATDASPVWSPDGRTIVFRSNRERVHDLYLKDTSGVSVERPFHVSQNAKYPTSWSADGRWIAFHTSGGKTLLDVIVAEAGTTAAPKPFLTSRFDEVQADFSPDGRWIAYASEEAGRFEVYLRSLDASDTRVQVSTSGGSDPHWRADGRELYYISLDRTLTAVAVREGRNSIELGAPERLFHVGDVVLREPYRSSYDVAADGRRFLVRVATDDVRSTPLTVLLNWSRDEAP
jgi:Tol biopolymer transport system component